MLQLDDSFELFPIGCQIVLQSEISHEFMPLFDSLGLPQYKSSKHFSIAHSIAPMICISKLPANGKHDESSKQRRKRNRRKRSRKIVSERRKNGKKRKKNRFFFLFWELCTLSLSDTEAVCRSCRIHTPRESQQYKHTLQEKGR